MGSLSVEVATSGVGAPCAHCGAPTTDARGFIYLDGNADAAYFAARSECAPTVVKLAVVIGEWDDDAEDATRRAFLMDAVQEPAQLRFAITDPPASPWRDLALASPLTRDEALSDGAIDHVFEVVDAVAAGIPPFAD